MSLRQIVFATSFLMAAAASAAAQGWIGDARRVGMGGVGDWSNEAWELAPKEDTYRSFPLPFGLLQVLDDWRVFNPTGDRFNPSMVLSLVSNPLHYTSRRGGTESGQAFLMDTFNATLSPDLNAYRGFTPQSHVIAGGVWSPGWGKTFWVAEGASGARHGFRVAAGPYLSIDTEANFEDDLITFFANPSNQYPANANLGAVHDTFSQSGAALKIGYRGRMPIVGGFFTDRNGLYVAADYVYLYGTRYEEQHATLALETDSNGLLPPVPSTPPLVIDRLASPKGHGFELNVSGALIMDEWEFTAAIDGMANRIDWERVRTKQYALLDITNGSDLEETSVPTPFTMRRSKLPLRVSGGATYDPEGPWSVSGEVKDGFRGFEVHGGAEYEVGSIALRAGTRYSNELLHPAWGAGFNLTRSFGIDLAFFTGASNIEKKRELSVAVSLRLIAQQP